MMMAPTTIIIMTTIIIIIIVDTKTTILLIIVDLKIGLREIITMTVTNKITNANGNDMMFPTTVGRAVLVIILHTSATRKKPDTNNKRPLRTCLEVRPFFVKDALEKMEL